MSQQGVPVSDGLATVKATIAKWAEDLIDLTRRNALLYFRHTSSASLEFRQRAGEVEAGLDSRGGWTFHLPPEPPEDPEEPYDPPVPGPGELVVEMKPPRYEKKILAGLKRLHGTAETEFLDAGVWVLYLGLGRLDWIDVDDKPAQSPLLLVPVRLQQEGADRRWRLRPSEDGEAALNPALAVKLEKDFGITLPNLDDLPDVTAAAVATAVRERVASQKWAVQDVAVLRTFTFHKEVMYRDLIDHADAIAEHQLVELLALGPASDIADELSFAPEPESSLDEAHPPEDLACILDVDATQRQCLIAARAGRSFVMDGPPGTGKSQTIANLIAQLLRDGRSVLFVSEKAAALEVVQNRLAAVRLDPFVLALHSHTSTRKAVAQELGRALKDRPTATVPFTGSQRAQLKRERQQLTAYATAVNEVRQPIGRSLHDVVGRIALLDRGPAVPIPRISTESMSADDLVHLRALAEQLQRSWGPVAREDEFLWRLGEARGGATRQAELRHLIERTVGSLSRVEDAFRLTTEELSIPAIDTFVGADSVVDLLGLIETRPDIDPSWLTEPDLTAIRSSVSELSMRLSELANEEAWLDARTPRWSMLSPNTVNELDQTRRDLGAERPPAPWLGTWSVPQLAVQADGLAEAARVLGTLAEPASILSESFGVAPDGPIELAARLADLGSLVGSPAPPDPSWLNPVVQSALAEARRVLADLLATYRNRRAALQSTFTDAVLELDLAALNARFRTAHSGFGKLSGAYRADKKLLAGATVSGKVTKDVLAKLDEAIEWQELSRRLAQAESQHAATLGTYYVSREAVDLDQVERAVAVADRALAVAAGDVAPDALARQLGLGGQPDPRVPQAAATVAEAIAGLRQGPLGQILGPELQGLDDVALSAAAEWCTTVAQRLRRLVELLLPYADLVEEHSSLDQLDELARRRLHYEELSARVDELTEAVRPMLGPLAEVSHPESLVAAVDWVDGVRAHFDGPVRRSTAEALLTTELTAPSLRSGLDDYRKEAQALLSQFEPAKQGEIQADLGGSLAGASELLDALTSALPQVDEWSDHVTARSGLASLGWEPLVSSLVEQRVEAGLVADTIERAALTRWVDEAIDRDERLTPRRSTERDGLLEEFRVLDRALVRAAAAEVINACSERRPRSLAGGAGVINQQAELKRRHKPVRRLLSEAGEAAQQLKPCFMMSPLSVAQFLPPGLQFDVVIFDEASQVREADAIGCIYRGRQLIVAGDQKQLPPTDFFSRATSADGDEADDTEGVLDFQSVLDRCKAQGIPSLPLNWHYRSRHESLIDFSNRSFYGGRLHTFPGAAFEAPDLGVELLHVDGVYRRGSTRDNPVEAEKVVDRVVFHRTNHPDLSLGVVAFSSAQQVAVESAIERRSGTEPVLRELVTDDRLGGFFVKNLENVQGDERDIIIFSVGYGPDENGKLTMNFGPLNRDGGERRLNVAITRARRRVEVVSSITAGQIRADRPAIRHLARYLDYAERGPAALAIEIGPEGADAESPFEEEVLRSIMAMGYDPVPQVGVAGYRVDIGVRHPTMPGSYVLGVECDGATYHSSKVARDRDRLRQAVLEGLGWTIHRIWSTAWFMDRAGEEARLKAAIEVAVSGTGQQERAAPAPLDEIEVVVDEFDFSDRPDWVYASLPPELAPLGGQDNEFTAPASRGTIASQIVAVVRQHGPVHRDVVLEAVRRSWDIGRAGSKIQAAFDDAIRRAESRGEVALAGAFLAVPGAPVYVRVPEPTKQWVRKVSQVPPEELDLAIELLLGDAGPTAPADLRTAWARLFGWRRVGSDIEIAFEDAVQRLERAGRISGPDPLRVTNAG